MEYTHIIISRVGIKWYDEDGTLRCEKVGLTWDEWLKDSLHLYDTYCRNSLQNQTNQNFILLSVFDESVTEYGNMLQNEHIIKVEKMKDINKEIRKFIKENVDTDLYLLSRLDRDDCYAFNFVDVLQNAANHYLKAIDQFSPYYFDTDHLNRYDVVNNVLSLDTKKYAKVTSPFTSVLLSSPDVLFIYSGHSSIKNKLPGIKLPNLDTLQIIHENNLLNALSGEILDSTLINRKLLEFNIKKSVGWCINDDLYNYILYHVAKGSTILELGSGYKTIDLGKRYKMISIENDKDWLNLTDNTQYIYAPIVDNWYDVDVLKKVLPSLQYDAILIDGPWKRSGNRDGFIRNIDLFDTNTIMIFDDTHRQDELDMCKAVSDKIGVPFKTYECDDKSFSVIKNKKK